jgi:hypothetical protein
LRAVWSDPCRFESGLRHQLEAGLDETSLESHFGPGEVLITFSLKL